MGIVSRIGRWIDCRFPEKISTEEVIKTLAEYAELHVKFRVLEAKHDGLQNQVDGHAQALDVQTNKITGLKDELNKAAAVVSMMTKMRQTPVMSSSEAWKR